MERLWIVPKETSNLHDLYSVAVFHCKEGIIGRLPRAISSVFSSFVDNSITIVNRPKINSVAGWRWVELAMKIVVCPRGCLVRRHVTPRDKGEGSGTIMYSNGD